MTANAFERILSRLEESDPVSEKTASAVGPVTSEEAMLSAVRKVAESTKTASSSVSEGASPVTSLETMAKEAAAREDELLMKTAHNMGAVICDGFFARMAQYDSALDHYGVKTASADDASLQNAYAQGQADMEKTAQDAFEAGYNDTLQHVYKTAAEIHYAGQSIGRQLLNESK